MPALLARIGIYVIATGIVLDTGLHYFGNFEYHFPLNGTCSIFLLPFGILLILAAGVAKLNARASALGTRLSLSDIEPSKKNSFEPPPQIVDIGSAKIARFKIFNTADSTIRRPA